MAHFPGRFCLTAQRALVRAGALFAVLLAVVAPAFAGSVTLAWDPVTSPLVAGYVIHYGPGPGNYTASVDVGNVATYTVSGLTEGAIYDFAVAAYDAAHVEGGLSNDVAATIKFTAPVASFSASTVSGAAPLALNFINASTGTITSYAWTFGDGTTSTAANPAKVYSTPGSYTVALAVTGPGGSNVNTKPNYITVSGSADATAPSAPGTVTVTAAGSTAISLSWTPATDNIGVTGYKLERCQGASCTTFAQIATPAGTSYSDSGLSAGTAYRYRIRATDAAGNLGPYSAIASATTSSGPDTTPPSGPATVTAAAAGSGAISLTWAAATDNVGVLGYKLERCQGASCTTFAQIATPIGTTFTNSGLASGPAFRYRVRATDSAGNLGAYSAIASATTASGTDTTPPSAPGTPIAAVAGSSAINLSWAAATDNVGVTGYRVERCQGASCTTFAQIAAPAGTSYGDSGLAAGSTYRYRVRATDAAGNLGAFSAIASATTASGADTTPPSAPGTPIAVVAGSSAINLSWAAATDNVGVTGYRVERCQGASCTTFAQIGAPTGTSYGDSGLAAGSTYRYRVRATDAAGNLGVFSAIASATTSSSGAADTTPPSAPASLTAVPAGSTSINLTWTAATDNVGVLGYKVERCQGASCTTFAQIATPTGTTFTNSGLAAGTVYRYRIRATDSAGNLGAYSAIAPATTSSGTDTTPPTVPGSLTSAASGATGINVNWSASTDNVGVTGYRIERCQGIGCTSYAQVATAAGTSFGDSGLAGSTVYSYRIRATDAAGNVSGYSNVTTATTTGTATIPIAFVQQNYATPQTPQSSVAVAYLSTQTAGNFNVVVVGWNDTMATVTSVTDSKGNVYTRAIGPTTYSTRLSQSIYYAKNIVGVAAGANVVTVRFSTAAVFPDIRVVEYSGVDRVSPVDAVALGTGTGTTSGTSTVTTTKANALLFAASTVTSHNTGPGPGFTSRVITSPDGDIVEDRVVAVTGSYSASAPMIAGDWVMQLVAFRGM